MGYFCSCKIHNTVLLIFPDNDLQDPISLSQTLQVQKEGLSYSWSRLVDVLITWACKIKQCNEPYTPQIRPLNKYILSTYLEFGIGQGTEWIKKWKETTESRLL